MAREVLDQERTEADERDDEPCCDICDGHHLRSRCPESVARDEDAYEIERHKRVDLWREGE